jgi:hypothetical protein
MRKDQMTDFMHETKKSKEIINFLTHLSQKFDGITSGRWLAPSYIVVRPAKKDS